MSGDKPLIEKRQLYKNSSDKFENAFPNEAVAGAVKKEYDLLADLQNGKLDWAEFNNKRNKIFGEFKIKPTPLSEKVISPEDMSYCGKSHLHTEDVAEAVKRLKLGVAQASILTNYEEIALQQLVDEIFGDFK